MSQKTKILKPKKRFEWSKVWYYVRSLWNNQVVVECGLTKKWYFGVIIALFSVLISTIPQVVHTATAQGSSFLNTTYIYNYDEGWYGFLEDAKAKGYEITFSKEKKTAELTGTTTSSSNNYLLYEHRYEAADNHATSRIDFQVYYVPKDADFAKAQSTIGSLDVNITGSSRDASYIIIGYENIGTALYKTKTYTSVGGVYGNYANLENDKTLSNFFITKEDNRIANKKLSLNEFKTFLNAAYIDNRTSLVWIQLGITLAVNAGITLLMGLVLFLMTRGKNNPNRDLKFLQAYNIGFWATLTPGLLALILGFFLSGYEIMLYVIIYGFRVMWLSMKNFGAQPR